MNDPKHTIYRLDKATKDVTELQTGAVDQFCKDFGVTKPTATSDLFDMLTNPTTRFIQNTKILYASDRELI